MVLYWEGCRVRSLLRVLFTAVLLIGVLAWPAAVQAEQDITIKASSYENSYPSRIKFHLEAESAAAITRTKLNYRIVGNPANNYAYPENFQPGTRVNVDYELNVQKTYIAPEVEIRYYWEIEDASGHRKQTEPATFTVTDTRFQWRQLEEGNIILLWYQGDETFARDLLSAATEALGRLSQDAGVKPKQRVKILVYANQPDLLGALEPGAHEWTGGRSFSSEGIILIAVSPSAAGRAFAARAIPHELSHVVVHQATDNPYGGIPQWLNEGLAMYSEGELEDVYRLALNRAVEEGSLLSLKTLSSNFPSDPQQATLSYAQSYSIVKYIIDRYGRDRLAKLLEVFSQGSTYDAATKAALGVSVDELERQWRASLGLTQQGPQQTGTPDGRRISSSTESPSSSPESPRKDNQPCGPLPLGVTLLAAALLTRRICG